MTATRRPNTVLNVFTNWGTFAVLSTVNFFLSPYIVHKLGNTNYGVWAIVGSAVGYLGLLDLGVRGAVTRYMARFAAQNDIDAANRLASSAFVLFAGTTAIALAVTAGFAAVLPLVFNIPSAQLGVARLAVITGGGIVATTLFSGVFGGTLAALQRYTLLGALELGLEATRVVAVLLALGNGGGILDLAGIQLAIALIRLCVHVALSHKVLPGLRIRLVLADRTTIRMIVSFSGYATLISASSLLILYSDSMVIGALLPISAVTFFAIAANLTEYTRAVLSGISQPLAPLVSATDAVSTEGHVARIVLRSARLGTLAIAPILVSFWIRGPTFVGLWMGPSYRLLSGEVLQVLSVALFFAASYQMVTVSMLGLSRHRRMVPIFIGEAVCNLILSLVLARPFGIVGVALGTMAPRILVAVWFGPRIAATEFGIPRRRFAFEIWVRTAAAMAPFAIASIFVEAYWTPHSLPQFFLQVVVCLPAALLSVWFLALDDEERNSARKWIAGITGGVQPGTPA